MNGLLFGRELFVSNPDNVIVVRLICKQSGQVSGKVSLSSNELPGAVNGHGKDTLTLSGSAWEAKHSDGKVGVNFQTWLRVIPEDGTVNLAGSEIEFGGANSVTIIVAANTNYQGHDSEQLCMQQLTNASAKSYSQLRAAHVADHQRLYKRVSINLGGKEAASQPTDERLAAVARGTADPDLFALFFQYGRYLLLAGSRADSPLPMNLQGIWNDNRAAKMSWTCDFHLDINTQQNYWHSRTVISPSATSPCSS